MSDFQHAQLDWDEHGQPLSRGFGDVYFSRASGLEETRYVFLAHNELPLRFAALPAGGRLSVGETGFGTGLNFLCAWQLFERTAPADARLHFVSVEKYPLTRADLQKALALWPELAPWADALLAQYVAVHPGFQRFVFADGRVVLTLLVGDVLERLPELDARIDAWFLDGFAPAKNPEMWTPALFAELARLSAPGASLATFTSAGFVRRGLNAAGFAMQRVKGFGQKREMLAGRFEGTPQAAAKPWFARPPRPAGPREALVIGAGLAGCAAAASLARRGWQVTLLERRAAVAEETSGNPQGVLYLKLSAHGTALSRLILAGFGFTRRLLQRLEPGRDWSPCGVLQLASDAREAARQAELAAAFPADLLHGLGRAEAEERAGVALDSGGLFYPEAGWVHPPALCTHLAAHPNIRLLPHREVLDLHREDGQWCARAGETLLARAPVAVLCGGAEIARFPEAAGLPLKRIRGQISRLPATAASRDLQTVLCAEGYVAPPRDGEHTLGASFRFDSTELELTAEEHAENLQLLREISTDLAERLQADRLDPAALDGRAGFRCTSPDYLPIAGPLADAAAFAEAYAVLGKDARQVPQHPCPWLEGLYVSSGHGSRGLLSAPLAGELLAAWLDDEPLPVPRAVAEACHPNRFGLRRLIRGK
ncbi:bifunctional tRNA (5-methylaminomethyl-2-thiouridine)(34)-methyltransferase MnmD/FAD-dependent 5-carboxymethylaminomethyl-2-thiouridine(34) oxidoreductase MnmC [Azotobacter chroococcum]|uniref:bifunctional tRNA (5-methylaminomethyl-2-thiouridine)(34)-methyltransferase MnmD/FAD-dependent 5-carboxymethylaminomethyl-2-thiouridine(34) oxidoreductase MnmC n=1 Tax=Azotobacter chroococcum TaxID=353 RepID=UPI00104058F9|nr:bifunctional tRNA (5-methylaminomethyl-2-thiouridine)(34)-methyltransferase MnmD/FAD-dependent 5-carboxymethylaminomethyl-2-thiouridine(34) oxidoreductase MnmC [Azotobacter chroococcum]TBW37801.1 bifunctional tRNA (5-methylaminomethyl-2-thiouridine)(34)-methyltransferase MnmD/FAD-dependent 5-carboxymethylaminomethyl-2-thiouridine(34) oxidoreductase MnmC [Azotobacter chroococcum]